VGSISLTEYAEFNVTPGIGQSFNYVTVEAAAGTVASLGLTCSLRSSVDAFTSVITGFGLTTLFSSSFLSYSGFVNAGANVTAATTFRLYCAVPAVGGRIDITSIIIASVSQ